MIYPRLITEKIPRNRPFFLLGARGVGKTTIIRDYARKFSNWIHLDLETASDRSIFLPEAPCDETLRAISFLKGKELRGNGTLVVLDEIHLSPAAIRWVEKLHQDMPDGRTDVPLTAAISSVRNTDIDRLLQPDNMVMNPYYIYPFSFEEFLITINDPPALEAFREVPVPQYAYQKLLNYFHLYSLIGGMPEVNAGYAETRNLTGLKNIYDMIEDRLVQGLQEVTAGSGSRRLAMEVLQNTYPFAATRISLSHFGNMEKGSREIKKAFVALEKIFFLDRILPVTSTTLPLMPDHLKFPRLQLLDTGLVNYFSGIQKPLFQSHDMNAIFAGQVARQVVGQELLATEKQDFKCENRLNFWVRNKAQSTAEVDFVIDHHELLIPVVVRSGEPGRLRSLHQFMDSAPHPFAVRLYAGNLAVQQTQTIRGKKFYLLNLPYFLAGKIRDHLKGFIRLADGK
jgi:predicted AAA+ superfamily ATPase